VPRHAPTPTYAVGQVLALQQARDTAESNTGKTLIIVRHGYEVGASGNLEECWLVVHDNTPPQSLALTAAGLTAAQAAAQKIAQGVPNSEVIVVQ
jgi:hypothetical protein